MKKLLIIVILLVLIGGLYWWIKKNEAMAPSTPSVDMSSWQTYRNEEYGFEFKYPALRSPKILYDGSTLIDLPIDPGTNLFEKNLNVSVSSSCPSLQMPKVSVDGSSVVKNGITFNQQTSLDGGMNQIYNTTQYTTTHNQSCFAIRFNLHSGNLNVYNAESPTVGFDKIKESSVFDQILSTFRFIN